MINRLTVEDALNAFKQDFDNYPLNGVRFEIKNNEYGLLFYFKKTIKITYEKGFFVAYTEDGKEIFHDLEPQSVLDFL